MYTLVIITEYVTVISPVIKEYHFHINHHMHSIYHPSFIHLNHHRE